MSQWLTRRVIAFGLGDDEGLPGQAEIEKRVAAEALQPAVVATAATVVPATPRGETTPVRMQDSRFRLLATLALAPLLLSVLAGLG